MLKPRARFVSRMALFESLAEQTRPIGANGYLEIARRRLRDEGGETEFLVLTRGFFAADGSKRWTKFVTFPDEPETKAWLAEALRKL